MKLTHIVILLAATFSLSANADIVKLSKSKICHTSESSYYNRIKNYTKFDTLEQCLNAGGTLPKNATTHQTSDKPINSSYKREYFGHGWSDADKDCQSSRMEVLISQSIGQVHYKTAKKCQVVSGRWISPYSGITIYKASKIDIDHVVPLKWAWDHGANKWTKEKREKFANDPANLLSVEASLNRQKGAKGLNEWLPPKNKCQYIVRYLRVVKTYGLTLSSAEESSYLKLKTINCDNNK